MVTKQQRTDSRQRIIDRYLAEHDPPLCACGCGDRVGFDHNGKPNRYIFAHSTKDTIEIGAFRQALGKLKAEKGWTIREMAERGGVQQGHMQDILYSRRRKGIERQWAVDFLRRLSGMPAPPTTWMKRVHAQNLRIDKEMEREVW